MASTNERGTRDNAEMSAAPALNQAQQTRHERSKKKTGGTEQEETEGKGKERKEKETKGKEGKGKEREEKEECCTDTSAEPAPTQKWVRNLRWTKDDKKGKQKNGEG